VAVGGGTALLEVEVDDVAALADDDILAAAVIVIQL
jgi:hypothetical protein